MLVLATITGSDLSVAQTVDSSIINYFTGNTVQVTPPDMETRMQFFRPLLLEKALLVKIVQIEKPLEDLPIAPPEPPKPISEEELKQLEKKENFLLRELRIFLREIIAKLARNKK